MENNDKKHCLCGCECGGGFHGGKHHLVKIILKLFIVIIIFWCGFKLGELTGFVRGEYGHGMMGRDGNQWGMMNGYDSNAYNLNTMNPGVAPVPAK